MLQKLIALITRLQEKKVDAAGLALFRVFYCFLFIGELWHIRSIQELMLYREVVLIPFELNFHLTLNIWIVAVFLLGLGFMTRYLSILNYAFTVLILGTTSAFEYHMDYAYTGINFLLMFLPISKKLSIDAFFLKLNATYNKIPFSVQKVSALNYLIPLFVAIGLIYFDSIFHKGASYYWQQGLGMWMPASIPQATFLDLSFLLNQKYLVIFMGYFTLLFEALFVFLFWFKRFRIILWLSGVGLHLGILFAFPIPWFAIEYIAIYTLLMPIAWSCRVHDLFMSLLQPIENWIIQNKLFSETMTQTLASINTPILYSPRFQINLTIFFIIFSSFCQIFITYKSPVISIVRKNLNIDNTSMGIFLNKMANEVHHYSRQLLGITPHGVFVDSHFKGYNHIIGLEYINEKTQKKTWLPLINERGQCDKYMKGRFWANWSFRVCSPTIDMKKLTIGLQRHTAYWLTRHGIGLDDAKIIVKVKKIDVPTQWEEDFLRKQMAKPWQDVGTIVWKDKQCQVTIPDIESI